MAAAPPARVNTDTFTAADYNFLANALIAVLKVLTSTQAYSRPTEVRIGGTTVYWKKDADGSLIFYDAANPTGKKLKDLIGQATAEWFIAPRGLPTSAGGAIPGPAIHLWPFKPVKNCTAIAIRDLLKSTTPAASCQAGIYSSDGILLGATDAWSAALTAATHNLSPIVSLSKDTYYWLALGFSANLLCDHVAYRPSLVKVASSATGALATSISIPSFWEGGTYGGLFPLIGIIVQDGFVF